MKLNQLNALVKVADLGSIRAAARAMDLTQPAISRSIRELEADQGVQLFERSIRGVVLTKAGSLLVRRARLVQTELSAAFDELGPYRIERPQQVPAPVFAAPLNCISPAVAA